MEDYLVKTEDDNLLLEKRSDAEMAMNMERLSAYRKMTEEKENE